MTVYRFEDLVIWQMAKDLSIRIYRQMCDVKDYGFKDQIQRAAVSIMNNIAEGFDRGKNTKDNKQFINFLNIAYGSCGEVKSMLYLSQELGYIAEEDAIILRDQCLSISHKIHTLIKTLNTI